MSPTTASPTTATVAAGSAISPGQQAFVNAIESKVGEFLSTKLDGPFHAINYPSGFHKVVLYGDNDYANLATMQDIDKMLDPSGNVPLTLADEYFSTLYAQLLNGATFQFSNQDKETIEQEETQEQEQVQAVLQAFTDAGFVFPNPLPATSPNKLAYVYNQVQTLYGGEANIPVSIESLQSAMETYDGVAATSAKLHRQQAQALVRLTAAVTNATAPTLANGGLQTSATTFYAGYTLPSSEQLNEALATSTNAVTLSLLVSNFTSDASQISVSGEADLNLPIADIFDITADTQGSYDASRYVSSGSSLTINITYPGITTFSVVPVPLSLDNTTGWYDVEIVRELMNNTGNDVTGYALISQSQYPIAKYFGSGNIFSHLRTFVLSQQPTVSMTFSGGNTSLVQSDFQANAVAKMDILDIFSVGSAGSYAVQKVDDSQQQGEVTVTFGPTPDSGVSPENEIAFVVGGVVSYPPAS
ncbi:hypothetical protein E4631_24180 [Hymenobacter sp. UV11]|uniref:hypothetical protein n=1 Tax=Hymenobacter sp. UV11 TaxID=1849735 RepID=UPI00105DF7C3|nr:hypothetical protein [Hymenobacter sp. UV11]TDN39144.1 hypothetical protein A8B98_20410 [Hymenobacter sp. UV11]TFZ62913.1 hypothetical protein E4631_24180 [Hymenobacter sp. UV11]